MKINILLITGTVILLSASQVQAVEYEVIILGTLGGEYSYAYAINDSGQVVGQSDTLDSQLRAFLWDKDNGMQNLGVLEFPGHSGEPRYSCATGINNSEQVVGYSCYHDGPEHAFLWENGQMHDINSPEWKNSHATAINNLGQIVGYSADYSGNWYEETHAFLWDHGIVTDLGAIQGGMSYARGINDHSQVVGEFYKPSNRHYNGCTWANGVFTDLGEIDEYGSFAGAINNSGVIVGHVTFRREGEGIVSQAMMWENYQMINLGYLEYPESFATAINDSGQIVGYARVIRGNSSHFHACLWQNGEIIDLTRFFPEEAPSEAYDINSSGQIVGCVEIGGRCRAFLMTPIPRPITRLVPGDYPTIQSAIDNCNNGDIVIVGPGIYIGDGNRDIDFLGKAITVMSTDPDNPVIVEATVIDCQYKGRGFIFINGEGPDSILSGLTITRGSGHVKNHKPGYLLSGGGGILFLNGSTPTISHCVITDNVSGHAGPGGGIKCEKSNPIIIYCVISNNVTKWEGGNGGGIWCYNSSPTISHCTIAGNSDIGGWFGGGGVVLWGGQPQLNHCTITNNSTTGEHGKKGGGIYCRSEGATISHCTIMGNSAQDDGGGIYFYRSSPTVSNCAITGNVAKSGSGGGIYCLYSSPNLVNCTFSHNSAGSSGGGTYCWGSSPTINSCILWGDTADSGSEISLSTYKSSCPSDLAVSYSNVHGGQGAASIGTWCSLIWGEGNIDTDPCFVQPGYWDANGTPEYTYDDFWVGGDYHLKSEGWRWDIKRKRWTYDDVTSRCIDAGNPGSPLGDELLSIPDDPNNIWGQNLRINMGAYGGTAEASMPPYDWAILGDLTNDGLINLEDYAFQAADWLNSADQQPGDLNRDSLIDISDLVLLVEDWLRQTTWHE